MIRTNGFLGISLLLVGVALQSRAVDGQRPFLCAGESPGRALRLRRCEILVAPERFGVRYSLDGQSPDWKDAVTHRMAQDSNHTSASQDLSAPAYLRSAWFRALVVAAILAVLAAFYRLRLLYVARESNIRLDERDNERMRLARDLHDTVLQSFQGALLKIHAVTYRLPDHLEARKELEAAIELARKAITEGRDAVQGLRSSTMATKDLVSAVTTLGEGLASDQNGGRPAFRVVVEGKSRDLAPLIRDEVYRIAGEALRNAFRHADAPRIDVDIHYDTRQFQIRVRDFGKGIDPNIVNAGGRGGHYGLPGIRERAELVGGKFAVWSELNVGTAIALTVPASIAYTKSAAPLSMFLKRGSRGSHQSVPRLNPDSDCQRPLDVPSRLAWS